MKRLNHTEVRRSALLFCCTFFILLIVSFLPVYFFLKSYQVQNDNIVKDLTAYKQILNKQQIVKQKTDSLFNNLALLNTGKVENDIMLEKYIADNKNEITRLIGDDSSSGFKQYAYLMGNVENILKQKDTITTISSKEQLALKDYMECVNKTRRAKQELEFDPARNFSPAK